MLKHQQDIRNHSYRDEDQHSPFHGLRASGIARRVARLCKSMLCHHAFKIAGTNGVEQFDAVALNLFGEQQSGSAFDQASQSALALDERELTQV